MTKDKDKWNFSWGGRKRRRGSYMAIYYMAIYGFAFIWTKKYNYNVGFEHLVDTRDIVFQMLILHFLFMDIGYFNDNVLLLKRAQKEHKMEAIWENGSLKHRNDVHGREGVKILLLGRKSSSFGRFQRELIWYQRDIKKVTAVLLSHRRVWRYSTMFYLSLVPHLI